MNLQNFHPDTIEKALKREIAQWNSGRERFLNIISPPYNSFDIFSDIVIDNVKLNKKVLYITNEESDNVDIINSMKNKKSYKNYTYIRKNSEYINSYLVISKHDTLYKISEKFDLVIYDDIKSFSNYSNREINNISMKMVKENGKVLAYSIEKIFDEARDIVLPVRKNLSPLVEPIFISTRVDINKDIPYVVYEYIEWYINSNRKVIIYVPDGDKVKNVYEYMSKYCSKFTRGTFPFINNISEKRILYNFAKVKKGIVITDYLDDSYLDLNNVNIMVFFADNKYYDYKKLVYLCGKVGINENSHKGEAIFLGNYETEDMDKAKSITRNFNKEAWDMNLLRI